LDEKTLQIQTALMSQQDYKPKICFFFPQYSLFKSHSHFFQCFRILFDKKLSVVV